MSDEEVRALERAAAADPTSRKKLTIERIRRGEGVLWLWVAQHACRIDFGGAFGVTIPENSPAGPPDAVEMKVVGFSNGGDLVVSGDFTTVTPPVPKERRAWVLACLDVTAAVLGREVPPPGHAVHGNMLLDLASGRLTHLSITSEPKVALVPESL